MTNLQQLRHFTALVEHGNFARAAEAVHLSQPALSRSIQALEASLDCRLLDRHTRGISLTVHGQVVLEHAQRLLAGSRALENAVSQLGNLEAGELLLGSGPYPAARLVPQALGRMASAWPRVRINLLLDNWWGLRDRLLRDELELFVADIRDLEHDPLLQIEALGVHPGMMFCRPGHPLSGRAGLSIDDMLEYPLAATQLPEQVEQELNDASNRQQPVSIQCDNFMVLKTLVAQSNVLSMAPWDVVADDVAAGRLVTLSLEHTRFNQKSAYGLVSRAGHTLSPAAQAMRLQILEDTGC
ncbi:LysR family transcriptional regulator [Halopseudomonas sp.]|uniref:LysR family transcriptional regulator n=1 Tax=Halopseudomonas sp. TaxID=2901191 RepID=UPI00356AD081